MLNVFASVSRTITTCTPMSLCPSSVATSVAMLVPSHVQIPRASGGVLLEDRLLDAGTEDIVSCWLLVDDFVIHDQIECTYVESLQQGL